MWEECVLLWNEDAVPVLGVNVGYGFVVEVNGTLFGPQQTCEEAEKGCFAAPSRTQNAEVLPVFYLEGYAVYGENFSESLRDVREVY